MDEYRNTIASKDETINSLFEAANKLVVIAETQAARIERQDKVIKEMSDLVIKQAYEIKDLNFRLSIWRI